MVGLIEKLWSCIQKAGIVFSAQHSSMQLGVLLSQQKPSGIIFKQQLPTAASSTHSCSFNSGKSGF